MNLISLESIAHTENTPFTSLTDPHLCLSQLCEGLYRHWVQHSLAARLSPSKQLSNQ